LHCCFAHLVAADEGQFLQLGGRVLIADDRHQWLDGFFVDLLVEQVNGLDALLVLDASQDHC